MSRFPSDTRGLPDRDLHVMNDLARFRLLTGRMIQRRHFEGATPTAMRRANRRLTALTRLGLIGQLDRRIGGHRSGSAGSIHYLTPSGRQLLIRSSNEVEIGGFARPGWEPGSLFAAHILAVSELATSLLERTRGTPDTEQIFQPEPEAWRSFVGPSGERCTLKPDAFAQLIGPEFEDHYFVEVDRGTESLRRIEQKLKVYVTYERGGTEQAATGIFPKVLWLVEGDARLGKVRAVLRRLPEGQRRLFVAAPLDQGASALLSGELTGSDDP